MFNKKTATLAELEAYWKGLSDGKYGFTYIHPNWSDAQLIAWSIGFSKGKSKDKEDN